MNINYENYEREIYGSEEEKQIKCIVCDGEDHYRYYLYLPNKMTVILQFVGGWELDEIELQLPTSIELVDNAKIIVVRDNITQTYKLNLEETSHYMDIIKAYEEYMKNVRSRI